jgi:multiple sugar transport system permease protein
MKPKQTFILPAIFFTLFLTVFPILFAFYISLTDWDLHQASYNFVGLQNYISIFNDPDFTNSVFVTLEYGIAALAIQIPLGFLIALLLDREIRGKRLFLTMCLVPMVLSAAVFGLLMRWMFNSNYGIINYFLGLIGIQQIPWLVNPTAALWSIILTDVWQMTPTCALMFYAGLQSLPREPVEAAMVDGASRIQTIKDVIIPMLRPLILFILIIRTMDALRIFDYVSVMTGGGPGVSTNVLSFYIYKTAFRYLYVAKAAAMSVVFLLILSILIFFYILFLYRKEVGELK